MNKQRIVQTGVKVDFHIHSNASSFKDGEKVKDLTRDNLKVLISELNKNEVNMCAITDHDNFDIDIYDELKKQEGKGTIQSILPAIEFSVEIESEEIHVIVIFDDKQPGKLKTIQNILFDGKDKPAYDSANKQAYKENTFIEIIKKIGLNTVMVAHQKNTLSSNKPRKNDATSLGKEKFNELIFMDYFDVYEFKNATNEIFNKYYLENNKDNITKENMRFITGSDCHNWSEYSEEIAEVPVYLKCLPTFRGLSMAVTDYRRIKHENSFFNVSDKVIDNISIKIKDKEYNIDVSKGINVIIGDNSIGKSLFLHKITDYEYLDKKTLKTKYEKYIKDNSIEIKTMIPKEKIYNFDEQGGIRAKFEGNTKLYETFKGNFPIEPSINKYKETVIEKVEEFIQLLNNKNDYEETKRNLENFNLVIQDSSKSLHITKLKSNFKEEEKDYKNILENYEKLINEFKKILANKLLEDEDKVEIEKIQKQIELLKIKYENKKKEMEFSKSKLNIISTLLDSIEKNLKKTQTDKDKKYNLFLTKRDDCVEKIIQLVKANAKIKEYHPNIETESIEIKTNSVGNYNFISKCVLGEISNEYVYEKLKQPFSKTAQKKIDFNKMTIKFVDDNLTNKDEKMTTFQYYQNQIKENIDKDFEIRKPILDKEEKDLTKEMSSGFNSKIYFDVISSQTEKDGIYIIDQPEDDVSPVSIKEYLLNDFKDMSEYRQVFIITHNPQFIVNLDVDNIIFLHKNKDTNEIAIFNGALEYLDDNTDVLKIVSENIEGGIDTIKERWKKYEKRI